MVSAAIEVAATPPIGGNCPSAAGSRSSWIADDEPTVLDRIRDESVHLALWRRPRPAALDWLDELDCDEIDDVQEAAALADLNGLPAILSAANYPDHAGTVALAREVIAHAQRFARIMDSDGVRIRLEVVETDACRKFHMDHVEARLLVPLTEPGTQWIEADPDGRADRATPIHQLRAGDVGLFKGRVLVETPRILHRSPPISGTGVSRLLLVLDTPLAAAG